MPSMVIAKRLQIRAHTFHTTAFFVGSRLLAPACLALFVACFGTGCGKQPGQVTIPPSTTPQSPAIAVSISPQSLVLKRGAEGSFSATVSNAKDNSVTWSVEEGSLGGSITDSGVYTAPSTNGVYHIIAASKDNPALSATATVTVLTAVFAPTGNLASQRHDHTATLLPGGQVLLIGGICTSGQYDLCDDGALFDPVSNEFQSSVGSNRAYHSATILPNGDVLLAGGVTAFDRSGLPTVTSSAEIFETGSGVLQPTGAMSIPRWLHTATALQDGRVLVVGGLIVGVATQTAEIYDPVSGKFSPAGSMILAHFSHTATLLQDGRVLISGNGSAELYNPATNSFTATANAPAFRFDSTATLLPDGKVLIAGGEKYYDEYYDGPAEIFDPASNEFTATGQLIVPRWGHTATLLPDGTVLLAGGFVDENDTPTTSTEIFDPAKGTFTNGPSMRVARADHTASLLPNGGILLAGGYGAGVIAEVYQ